jgi:peptidoglycan/xylan/chitin deacetylase (PgdA/CDA1 family)
MSPLVPFVAGASCLGVLAHGTYHRNSPLFGRVLHRLPGESRQVALTFDDGPNAQATPRVLDALQTLGVPATFFLLGRAVERFPAIARRVVDEGHSVGNHGYAHRKLHTHSPAAIYTDISRGAEAIRDACGVRPRFFRAPHGFRNPWVSPVARGLGETTVGWTLGVWDSDCPGAEIIAQRVVSGARPGSIVLLHDGDGYDLDGDRRQTAGALPQIITGLRERGFTFMPLPVV